MPSRRRRRWVGPWRVLAGPLGAARGVGRDPVPAHRGAERTADHGVDLAHRRCRHRLADVSGASRSPAVVLALDAVHHERPAAAPPQLRVERLEVPGRDLGDRDLAERRADRALDVADVGLAGAVLDLDGAEPLVDRVPERDGTLRGPRTVDLGLQAAHEGHPIGPLDRLREVPVATGHRVDAGEHAHLQRAAADAHAAPPAVRRSACGPGHAAMVGTNSWTETWTTSNG